MSSTASTSLPLASKKQKHVTTACLNCRKRKVKCDGAGPPCSNCSLYSQQCIYQLGLDKRKVSVKDRLAAAEAYTQELERLLTAGGISLPRDGQASAPAMAFQPSATPFSPTGPSQAHGHKFHSQGGGPVTAPSTGPVYPSPTEGSSPLVDQITGSLGSLQLAEDGQLRFYGATSNLHLLIKGTRRSANRQGLTHPSEVQAVLQAAGVGQIVDAELEEHLIHLYFCWEDPSIHLVQEEIFYRERERCKSGYGTSKLYSEVLVNSMCAVGASFTSRHCETLPENLVDFFAFRARALLEVELDSPTLSTVQSLGILSGVESIRTLDARGWLYSGMAVRLATDLGLHLDNQIYLDAGIIDHEEALARRVVFWGAFIHERMWSLYLGRPVSLNENSITTPPYVAKVTEQKYWQPYIDDCEDSIFPQLPDPIEELHRNNASLCAKMTRVRETLYSDAINSAVGAQQLHDFASNMRAELVGWHDHLPDSLRVDLTSISALYVPHVIQLHMQYHTLMILVHRPFFAATITTMPDVAFSDPLVGRTSCTDSARSISKLLQIYRRLYGLRRINIQAVHLIFTASLVHVLNACESVEPSVKNSAWKDLEVCQQALSELSKGFQSASRALEVVNGIKDELLRATRENAKRSSPDTSMMESDGNVNAKRRRSTAAAHTAIVFPENMERAAQEETIRGNSMNSIDSLFWSELTSLEFSEF
ncbi:hypothetical protein ACEQ8H_004133 [Pleosporales sp. CAS-2024a]